MIIDRTYSWLKWLLTEFTVDWNYCRLKNWSSGILTAISRLFSCVNLFYYQRCSRTLWVRGATTRTDTICPSLALTACFWRRLVDSRRRRLLSRTAPRRSNRPTDTKNEEYTARRGEGYDCMGEWNLCCVLCGWWCESINNKTGNRYSIHLD